MGLGEQNEGMVISTFCVLVISRISSFPRLSLRRKTTKTYSRLGFKSFSGKGFYSLLHKLYPGDRLRYANLHVWIDEELFKKIKEITQELERQGIFKARRKGNLRRTVELLLRLGIRTLGRCKILRVGNKVVLVEASDMIIEVASD